jgi:DNA-binding MurR/RpiR family transcriptional regulator
MVNLGIRVFENYTLQDILGELPPADKKLEEKLESRTAKLIQSLGTKSKSELQEILLQHIQAKQEMTKFSGAQALDQSKIEMFHEFLSKYIAAIESKIK